jgi:hypothetical protein
MLQLYLLSILLNAVSGFALLWGYSGEENALERELHFSFQNGTFRLVLGVLTLVTGLLKLLSPVRGIPVLGDLVPALAGLGSGFLLLLASRQGRAGFDNDGQSLKITGTVARNRKWVGFAALGAAAIHFIFPQISLL